MAFALLIIGITLVVAAVRGTHLNLIQLIWGDFTGPANFWYWIAALLLVGMIGYIPKLKALSDGLLVIIILSLLLARSNPKEPEGGFFKQLTDALGTTKNASSSSPSSTATPTGPLTAGRSGGRITLPGEWTTLPDGTVLSPTGN